MKLRARVPATVANLGPGFDCLAMAVDLWNEVVLDTEAPRGVEVQGEGAGELPEDEDNLVVASMLSLAREVGKQLPSFGLSCVNRIPLERGLGSSAAAVVAGLVLADRLLEVGSDRLFELAVDLEGHADNVAAALRGGVTLAYRTKDGWRAESLTPSDGLHPVVLVPEDERVPTAAARSALPPEVPREDSTFNLSRSALLVLALTSRPDLMAAALEDRLHQTARLALAPASLSLFDRLQGADVPVCVAGAGPSLLAFELRDRLVPDPGPGWRVIRTRIAAGGAQIGEA